MSVTRMEHYVPRSYLRKFASNRREQLYAFDKKELRSFKTSVNGVLKERDFYDLPSTVAESTGLEVKLIEGGYSRLVDGQLMRDVHQFLEQQPDHPVDFANRVHVAQFIVFQYYRTRSALNLALEIQQKFIDSHIDGLMKLNYPEEMQEYKPSVTSPTELRRSRFPTQLFE